MRWYILFALLVSTIFIWSLVYERVAPGVLSVSFLDVGQGDAIFIESPIGVQVLVDGGSGRTVLRSLGKQMGFFDRSLDVLIATHPDADHIGGLPDVLKRYDVSYILDPAVMHDTSVYEVFKHLSEEEPGAEYITARRGQVIDLGDGSYLRILFPDRDVSGVETNSGSIIAQVVYGETEVLLTGDAPQAIERYLTALDGLGLRSDILKIGHHGSRTSSDEIFIGFTGPEYAILSRGCDNSYGHPHAEVLETLAQFEIEILDTCEIGTITFESDGTTFVLQ